MLKHCFPLAFIGLFLIYYSCKQGQKADKDHVVNCVEKHFLTPEQEVSVRKRIHAEEKALALDTIFQKKWKKQGFSGVALVAQQGVILYEKAFGFANYRNKDTLSLQSAFQLASISKTFTGVGVLLLAQEKKLELSDSLQKFIPDFPYPGITVEHLLSHRSGLPNYMYAFECKRQENRFLPNNDSILDWFCHSDTIPPAYNLPGRHFSYNNSNFVILASIIEKVSGMTYEKFIRTRVFEPVGMKHSFVDTIAPGNLLQWRTNGHQGNHCRKREFYDGVYGDKGIYSTAGDMFRYYVALHSGCLLGKHWLNEAFTPRSFERRSRHNYGLGFRLMTHRDNMHEVHYVYHGGWWAGFSTMLWMDPKSDIVIIVLGNRKNNAVYEIKPILSVLEPTDIEDDTSTEE